MSEARIDVVVVGAGVVGLAVARALALPGREVVVLERNTAIGAETSARNSEVIHAGIYYPSGSLKARLCVAGKQRLYEYCASRSIGHRRCGKVIVATDASQHVRLEALEAQAAENGVDDLRRLDAAELCKLEPEVRGTAGLWSPSTGIVDSHALMLALQGDLESAGGTVALLSALEHGTIAADGFGLRIVSATEQVDIHADVLVNAGGLEATDVAAALEGFPQCHVPACRYAKGSYFLLGGRSPFSHLVYPLPDAGGLGIHATLDLGGRVRFGPDVEWIDAVDYSVDTGRADVFEAAVRRYWPAMPDGALSPGYAGIRPKLVGPGEPAADFMIQGPAEHGVGGLVNLFGIESPGLTSALAIGEHVAGLLSNR